jgi:glutamine amidotransferase/cyclase
LLGQLITVSSKYLYSRHYSSLEVAAEYFRSGADKISIGSDAVYAAEEYLRTGVWNSNYCLFL